jgi:hypothetical protein
VRSAITIDESLQCSCDLEVFRHAPREVRLDELPKMRCCAFSLDGAAGFDPVIEVLRKRCNDQCDPAGPLTSKSIGHFVAARWEQRKLVRLITPTFQARRTKGPDDALRTDVADGSVGPMDEVCDLARAAKAEAALHRVCPLVVRRAARAQAPSGARQ